MKRSSLQFIIFLALGIGALLFSSHNARAETITYSKKEECAKCHAAEVKDVDQAGGRHRSVPCIGCHPGHPPEAHKRFADCAKCHLKKRKLHFNETGCLNCHRNPHTPLKISFQKGRDDCLNCHGRQVKELSENKSKHSTLDCAECHDVHRKIPECTQCHQPHSGVTSGCKQCHKPHVPNSVTYPADVPSKDCGACHEKQAGLLGANASKHGRISCAQCHQQSHKAIPACANCHGTPHPKGIMIKFPKCADCHNSAHDLNHWPETGTGKTPVETPHRPFLMVSRTGKAVNT